MVLHRATGGLVPARCDSLGCYSCIIPKAIRRAQALAQAAPTQWLTLTKVGDDWASIHGNVRRLQRRLRRRAPDLEWCYQVEENPNGTGNHIHAWLRGPAVDVEEVGQLAADSGMGHVAFEGYAYAAAREYRVPTIEYGFKAIVRDRPDEPTEMWPEARAYLALNGRRLTHTTEDFWLDSQGRRTGVEGAERDVVRVHAPRAPAA